MRFLLLAALAGCAHAPTVTTEQVVRLPPAARRQIIDARRSVDAADQNLTAARVAVDEAKRFRDIADRELDAARAHADAAKQSMDLGARAHAELTLEAARREREVSMRELFAARAKKDYSDRLVDLRHAEEDLRRAERDQARADFEYTKYVALRDNGIAGTYNEKDFLDARKRAQSNLADARSRVAALTGNVEALRTGWMERANEYQTASRGATVPPPPPPPPVPTETEGAPVGAPSPGANEGPSAPQSMPESYPQY
jgi:hypothetical protein